MIKNGMFFGVGFLSVLGFSVLIAQTLNSFSSGDLISASSINTNFQNIKTTITDNHAVAAPEGAIMAFYLAACPTGWVTADGTSSTPDLRGVFIRGMDDMGSAAGAANRDPGWGARGASLGSYQADDFASHNHNVSETIGTAAGGPSFDYLNHWGTGDSGNSVTFNVGNTGGNETRPRNVALIYCMRQN